MSDSNDKKEEKIQQINKIFDTEIAAIKEEIASLKDQDQDV
jgi:hypothetical protein